MKIIAIDIAKFHHCAMIVDDFTGKILVKPFFLDNDLDGFTKKSLLPLSVLSTLLALNLLDIMEIIFFTFFCTMIVALV